MKINDTDYNYFLKDYLRSLEQIKADYGRYIAELKSLAVENVLGGKTLAAFMLFTVKVCEIPKIIDEIEEKIKLLITNYLKDMDDAQKIGGERILYQSGYIYTKDYSDEAFQRYKGMCDSIDYDAHWFNVANDKIENLLEKLIKFIAKASSVHLFHPNQMRVIAMEINDVTERKLMDIKGRLDARETQYSIEAENLMDAVFLLCEYTSALNKIMSSDVSDFSTEKFSTTLGVIYDNMLVKLKDVDVSKEITEKDIKDFIDKPEKESKYFFEDQFAAVAGATYELATSRMSGKLTSWYTWETVILKHYEIDEVMLKQKLGVDYNYYEYKLDMENMALIDEVAQTEQYKDSDIKKYGDYFKKFMGYVEKYGDHWEAELKGKRDSNGKLLLDRRTKEYKQFKKFYEQFGNAKEILGMGGDIVEIFAYICVDYDKNIEILETLKRNYVNDPEMAASFERIQKKYDKDFCSYMDIFREKFIKYLGKAGKKLGEVTEELIEKEIKPLTVLKVVGKVEEGIDFSGKITGRSDDVDAMMNLGLYGPKTMSATSVAYHNAYDKLKKCDPGSDRYEELLKDFETSFCCYKTSLKRMYDNLAVVSRGMKRAYYEYCSRTLEDLTIKNSENFKMMTYEQYASAIR